MTDSQPLLHWWDAAGLAGSALIVAGFFLLQIGRLRGDGPIYQMINLIGALAILVSLVGGFNISVFLLESTWALIALYGLARSFRLRRQR